MSGRIVLRSMFWYGEGDGPAEFTALPPAGYEQYSIVGTLRVVSRAAAPIIDSITIADTETSTAVTFRGEAASITLPGDARPEYVKRLWSDARYLAGQVRRGRPPRMTNIESDEQILVVVAAMRKGRYRITQRQVAATSGTFTLSALRNYLSLNGRRWQELIGTKSAPIAAVAPQDGPHARRDSSRTG